MDRVGARLERHSGNGAARATELSIEIAGAEADALDGISRRNQHLEESGLFVVVYAFNLKIIREA